MTASTLYEAVEPLGLYKQLLAAVLSDISAESDSVEVTYDALLITTLT